MVVTQAKKSNNYKHFAAVRSNGKLYIGYGLKEANAVSRLKKGKDTWSTSKNNAKTIAKKAGNGKRPVGPEIDRKNGKPIKGRYYHFHPYKRKPACHAFYGGPVK